MVRTCETKAKKKEEGTYIERRLHASNVRRLLLSIRFDEKVDVDLLPSDLVVEPSDGLLIRLKLEEGR